MGTFNPSDTFRVLLVDPNENPYSLSGIFAMGSFNPSDTARVVLVDPDGNPYKATGGSGGGATIQVNGVDTSDQTLLNFVDTASVTWANPSGGIVEATAITGGTGTVTQVNTTAPITGGPITTTGTIGITQASASVNGFLSSTDWNTFNNKVSGPAGSNTEIQYNNSGAFGASAFLKWDTTGTPTVFVVDNAIVDAEWPSYDASVNSSHSYFFTGVTTPPTANHSVNIFQTENTSTAGTGKQLSNISSILTWGKGGVATVGNGIGIDTSVVVEGNGSASNEHAAVLSVTRADIGTGYTQSTGPAGAYWGADITTLGPIGVQPVHLSTGIWNIENFYNGGVTTGKSSGHWIVTSQGTGGGLDPTHAAADTFPIDVGLGISGKSFNGAADHTGFTTGIQIGGSGSPWEETDSIIGTGIDITQFQTRGIYVHSPIGTPTADIETTGKVIVGGNLTNSVLTASELVGTDASKNLASVAVGTGLSLSGGTLSATGGSGTVVFQNPGLRLTLTTGVPVTTSDVTAAGTLYWTPMFSGNVWYWDGAAWQVETITEQSLALTLTSGKNYDVFYLHGTGLVLSSAWTNDTTRADALGTQDGVKVLASDHTKLWIGTIRASGTNITEDSNTKRFVYNSYNKVKRQLIRLESTDQWAYTSTTWRQANGSASNQVEAVVGDLSSNIFLSISILAQMTTNGTNAGINIAEDSTTTPDTTNGTASLIHCSTADSGGDFKNAANNFNKNIPLGYHKYVWLESGDTGVTFFSFNSGQRIAGLVGYSDN